MNLFAKAARGESLTPGQRGLIKAFDVLWQFVVSALIIYEGPLANLAAHQQWHSLALLAATALGTALLAYGKKFATAQGDAPLATALGTASAAMQQAAETYVAEAPAPHADASTAPAPPPAF